MYLYTYICIGVIGNWDLVCGTVTNVLELANTEFITDLLLSETEAFGSDFNVRLVMNRRCPFRL